MQESIHSCHMCSAPPSKQVQQWLRIVLPVTGDNRRGANDQLPTESLPLDAWVKQPTGRRKQIRARAESAAAAGAPTANSDPSPHGDTPSPSSPGPSAPVVQEVSDDDVPSTAQAALANARTRFQEAEQAVAVEEKQKKDATRSPWQWMRDLERKISRSEKTLAGKITRVDEITAELEQLTAERDSLRADVERRTSELQSLRDQLAQHHGGAGVAAPVASWTQGIPANVLEHPSISRMLQQVEMAIQQVREAASQIASSSAQPEPAAAASVPETGAAVPDVAMDKESAPRRSRQPRPGGRHGTSPQISDVDDSDSSADGRSRSRERRDREAEAMRAAAA